MGAGIFEGSDVRTERRPDGTYIITSGDVYGPYKTVIHETTKIVTIKTNVKKYSTSDDI